MFERSNICILLQATNSPPVAQLWGLFVPRSTVNVTNTPSISSRFSDERSRLGLSQQNLAELCGSNRKSIARYEGGENVPGGEMLAAFAAAGADVLYILTGQRAVPVESSLSREEECLLDNYRNTAPEYQGCIQDVSAAMAQQGKFKVGNI